MPPSVATPESLTDQSVGRGLRRRFEQRPLNSIYIEVAARESRYTFACQRRRRLCKAMN
jgi:hypothetical protein